MTLEILSTDFIAATKARDGVRKAALSAMIQAVKKAGIDNMCRDNIPEDMVNAAILKEQKTLQEMIDTCPADRPDIKDSYMQAKAVVDEYAPNLMSAAEDIKNYVASLGLEFTKANRPQIMKALKGKADMKIANSLF